MDLDHEIFRLRDEVAASEGEDVTFYDFIGIKPSASQDDLNKAFRKRSRALHPDKARQNFIATKAKEKKANKSKPGVNVNKPPSEQDIRKAVKLADERFQRLGVVAEILKGSGRVRYDHFLQNGFPAWRGTGYYYARFRPGLGSVLLGLFVSLGGLAHYAALYLSWKNRRDFVGRYIRHARRAAWGDEMGIKGIPSIDTLGEGTPAPPPPAQAEGAIAVNRRQKRMMEKEAKKEKPEKKPKRSGTSTPVENGGSRGEKKRVVAENGKVLIVDEAGNVYLEEEMEDGTKEEFLLDINEIPKPSFRDTVLFKLPLWAYRRATGKTTGESEAEVEEEVEEPATLVNGNGNGDSRRIRKRATKSS